MKNEKITLTAPLTYSDWFIHESSPEWGEEGVRSMLEQCRGFGFSKILWRTYDAGRATYTSRLAEPFKWNEHEEIYQYSPGYIDPPSSYIMGRFEQIDHYKFDSLESAVRIGHELGLEIHAWMTINEDDHGLGFSSRFSREHPEYRWVGRNGSAYHSQLSFAFEEVREYKLELIKEVLEYDVDGIFLDWARTGDIRNLIQHDEKGTAEYGYEKPNMDTFIQKYGINPYMVDNGDDRWVSCRAEPLTVFMRSVKETIKKHTRQIPVCAMVYSPNSFRGVLPETLTDDTPGWVNRIMGLDRVDGALKGLLCDVHTWAEEGLVDELVVAGYYIDGDDEKAYRYLEAETGGKVPLWLYCWVPDSPEDFCRCIEMAEKFDTREILFWEADYIDLKPEQKRKAIIEAVMKYKDGHIK